MTSEKRQAISKVAAAVRDVLGSGTPIDLEHYVNKLGGRIEYVEGTRDEAEASIQRDAEGNSFTIRLSKDKTGNRRRFSLAHELGHLFLHMGFADPSKWQHATRFQESYNRDGYGEQEFEANEFAAALLMPEDVYGLEIAAKRPIEEIARHFGVSTEAATVRGRWLGLINW